MSPNSQEQKMTDGSRAPLNSRLEFETWKMRLRKDCEAQGKLPAFDSLGDYALKLFWEDGVDPSVQGIVGTNQRKRRLG